MTSQEPTLGAFLAYLEAAESEEFGLEAGQVGETDSVKLATVHAAKGLQWAAVFVPGLAGGAQRHVFPAKPRVTTRWTENARLLPFSLRGDAADLPQLPGLAPAELAAFGAACTARDLAEERRLGYVAATRAAFMLGCSGYWWSDGSRGSARRSSWPRCAACLRGRGRARWRTGTRSPTPTPSTQPLPIRPLRIWPAAAAASARHAAIREAGALVEAAARELRASGPAALPPPEPAVAPARVHAVAGPADPHHELIAAWTRDTDLLLAERPAARQARQCSSACPASCRSRR